MLEANDLRERAVTRVQAVNWNDELDLMVLGSCLHNMYNSIEAYLLRVAKFFENSVDERQWHRDLLDRMTLEIPDVRLAAAVGHAPELTWCTRAHTLILIHSCPV